jgi:hypothetical protein
MPERRTAGGHSPRGERGLKRVPGLMVRPLSTAQPQRLPP